MGRALLPRARRLAFRFPTETPRASLHPVCWCEEMVAVMEPQEIEDEEHEQVLERVAAVDVARASGWCVPGYPICPGRAGGAFRPFTRLVAHDGSCFAAKSAASSAGGYSRGVHWIQPAGWP